MRKTKRRRNVTAAHFYIPVALADRIRVVAEQEGRSSVSEMIRVLLQEGLATHRVAKVRVERA